MIERLVALIVDESKWLTWSLGLALLAVTVLLYRQRRSGLPLRRRVLAAMSLFFGITIGTMAFGHLLAVTTKLTVGTLGEGPVLLFYLIGIVLAVPSWWLTAHTLRSLNAEEDPGRRTMFLNAGLVVALLILGLPNLPLAVPGVLNIAYHHHARRAVGWAIVGIFVLVKGGLLIGSLIFLASGQTFEEFQGIQ